MKYKDKGIWAKYLGAVYWSVSCLKGTDNDWALTMSEKMVAVAVMIAGGGVYTIMIGEVVLRTSRRRARFGSRDAASLRDTTAWHRGSRATA